MIVQERGAAGLWLQLSMRVTCRVVGSWAGVTDPHPATNTRSEIEMRRSPLVSFMIGNAPFYSCLGTIVQKLLDLHNVVRHSISVIWSISHILKLGHCCVL